MFGASGIEKIKDMVAVNFPERREAILKSVYNTSVSANSHIILKDKESNREYRLVWLGKNSWGFFLSKENQLEKLDIFEWDDEKVLSILQSVFDKTE
ncbi:MAG: hypothetical protein V3574_01715 [Candidatus Moraniibacteriota bacterium]